MRREWNGRCIRNWPNEWFRRTREGIGKKIPEDRQLKEVTILDRFNNVAVVKVVASDWVDYLEVAKFNGEWKIINVLWELKPKR